MSDTKNGGHSVAWKVLFFREFWVCNGDNLWKMRLSHCTEWKHQPRQKTDYNYNNFIMEVAQLACPIKFQFVTVWDVMRFIPFFYPQEQSKKKRLSGLDAHKAMMGSFLLSLCRRQKALMDSCARRTFWQLRQFQTLCGTLMFSQLRVNSTKLKLNWKAGI